MGINETSIVDQILNRIRIKVFFPDTYSEPCDLIERDGRFWFNGREIPVAVAIELKSQFTDEQEFNTDPEVIRTELDYDSFMNKYFNQY